MPVLCLSFQKRWELVKAPPPPGRSCSCIQDQRSIGAENISIAYRLPPHTFFQFALDSEVKIRYKNIETTDGVQIWRIKVTLH